jgi:NADH dehydrogenase FAD-containing subunit
MQQTKETQIIVLGGGYAGTLAALSIAGRTKGQAVEVVLVNGADHFVERIRHHQLAAGQQSRQQPFADLLAGSRVRFVQGWCTDLAPVQQQLTVQTTNGAVTLAYDYLIYALGSTIERSRIPGVADYAHTLADEASAQRLQEQARQLAANQGRLLVIGGGLTGIEAATELAESYPGLQVTLATRGKVGATLSPAGAAHIRRVFARLGITLVEDTSVERLTATAAECADGRRLPFDGCLWAGSFAVPQLAAQAGLPVDHRGRLLVDEQLRVVNHPAIYAAGDVAATPLRMACATAMPMGAYVASHLAAQLQGQPAPAPFRFSYLLQCISLGRHNGLVQFVASDDRPKRRIITGWLAARIKETICRFTVWSLHQERRWPGSYYWPQGQQMGGRQTNQSQQVRYGQSVTNL